MLALKEKVSDQLSRLFADSPPSSSSSSSSSSCGDDSQVRPDFRGAEPASGYFSFGLSSLIFPGSKSNNEKKDWKPIQSPPVKFEGKVRSPEACLARYHECNIADEDEEIGKSRMDCEPRVHYDDGNEDFASGRNSRDSDVFEEARDNQTLPDPLSHLLDESTFISSELYEFLESSIPNIVKGCQWTLLYSTSKHGISLRTLIRKSAEVSGPCLLVAGDRQGAIFGGLLDCPLNPTPKRKYQGTIHSFVFTTIYGEPRLFRPTGANRYYYICMNDLLAFGGGSNFALCLDGDLLNATSGPSETFGNLCLAHSPDFELKNVELWGFTHASKYLS